MSNHAQSQHRNQKARRNIPWVTKKEWAAYAAITLVILALYLLRRGW